VKLINPLVVTPSILQASNVPEDDAPTWVSGNDQDQGDLVIYEHRIYEALIHITGPDRFIEPNDPQDPPIWLDLGATNRFRMFDQVVDTMTTNPSTIEVELVSVGVINGIALFNLGGTTLTVEVVDSVEGTVYGRQVLLQDNSNITSWYAYFFEPIVQRPDVVLTDLPNYRGASVFVTVDAGMGTAQVGELAAGQVRQLGVTNFGTSIGIQDYSRKERDQFGNTIIVERRFAKRAEYDVTVETSQVFAVQNALAQVRAMPVVYIGDENRASTLVFGFFRDFRIILDTPSISSCTIEVEGLT
jgi:hypothetical protein